MVPSYQGGYQNYSNSLPIEACTQNHNHLLCLEMAALLSVSLVTLDLENKIEIILIIKKSLI